MLLLKAVKDNNISDVKKLLKEGADVNAKNKHGNTALHFVKDKEMASLLLSSFPCDLNIQNNNGDTPIHMYCIPPLELLNDLKTDTISLRHEMLGMLLEAGASPDIQNHLGYGVLHSIFVYGGIAGMRMDINTFHGVITVLLKHNANVNLEDFEGCTPLHHAAREPNMKSIVELLLQAGANVNAKDRRGMTPLHYLFDLDDEDMAKLLLYYDGSINEKDINGTTVLSSSALEGNEFMAELLLKDPRIDINLGDLNSITPLHLAAAYKRIGVCEMLIAHGADVNALDAWNATPLHYAAYGGTPEIISLMLEAKANHRLKDDSNYLPIQYALDRHYFYTAWAFGEEYQQEIKAHFSTADQYHATTELEDQILQSFPGDDVLTMIVPASKVYSNPYNQDILPPDTMDYIKMKTNKNSSAFLRGMIEVPGIGKIPDIEEAREIRIAVESYIGKLTSVMAEIDPRFRGALLCSGSVYEGTKICDPYEFDYMLCLEHFEQVCTIQLDEQTQFDNVQVSKAKIFVDDQFEEFFDENHLQSDNLMTVFVEVARKAISRLGFVTGCSNLYFQSLTEHTLVEATWTLPGTVTCNLKLIWNGLYYKQLVICVDLVPAIHIKSWPLAARKESLLLTDNIRSKGCHIVSKAGYWRLSFSLAEKMIMENLSNEERLAFVGAKVLLHSAVSAKITIYDDSVLDDASNNSDQDITSNAKPGEPADDAEQEITTDAASSSCLDETSLDTPDVHVPLVDKQGESDASTSEGIASITMAPHSFPGTMEGRVMTSSGTPLTMITPSDKQAMLNLEMGDRIDITVREGQSSGATNEDKSDSEIPAKTLEPRDVLSTYLLKMVFFHCLEENLSKSPGTNVTTYQLFKHLYVCLKEKLPLPYYFMENHNLMDKLLESEELCETEFIVMVLNTFLSQIP